MDIRSKKDGRLRDLWGRRFRIVKNGLDEVEVRSFVDSLIAKNKELAHRLENLSSLRSLAERMVVEAEKQAHDILEESARRAELDAASVVSRAEEEGGREAARLLEQAVDKAKAEAESIIAEARRGAGEAARTIISRAEEQAQDVLSAAGEKATATRTAAEEEAQRIVAEGAREADAKAEAVRKAAAEESSAILAEARQKAETAERQAAEIMGEASEKVESIIGLAGAEARKIVAQAKQEVEALVKDRAAQAEQEARTIVGRAVETAASEAKRITREAEQLLSVSRRMAEGEMAEAFRRVLAESLSRPDVVERRPAVTAGGADEARPAAGVEPGPELHAGAPAPSSRVRPPARARDPGGKEGPGLYSGEIELAVLPPVALDQMLRLHRQLTKIPEVKVLDVKGSAQKGIVIRLLLETDIPLVGALEALPDVEKVSLEPSEAGKAPHAAKGQPEPEFRRIVVAIRK